MLCQSGIYIAEPGSHLRVHRIIHAPTIAWSQRREPEVQDLVCFFGSSSCVIEIYPISLFGLSFVKTFWQSVFAISALMSEL